MGVETGIAWCDHTFNPWWGCEKVSPACKNCYAETFDHRLGGSHWGPGSMRKIASESYWKQPLKWNKAAEAAGVRRRVFCASMADVFEKRDDLVEHRARLFALIAATPWLDWLLLTKRPENIADMLPDRATRTPGALPRAPFNVWLGTTIESTDYIERADHLLMITATVHFLSCEPLLGRLDLTNVLKRRLVTKDGRILDNPEAVGESGTWRHKVDWVIVGCESGHGSRPTGVQWYRDVRDQCAAAGASFFFKQAEPIETTTRMGTPGAIVIGKGPGSWTKGGIIEQPYLDGKQHIEFPKGLAA